MQRSFLILALLIICGWLLLFPAKAGTSEQASTPATVTAFRYVSDPHEFVGGGHKGTLSTATGSLFIITQDHWNGLVCSITPNPAVPGANRSIWTLTFYMGHGTTPHTGNYVARLSETTGITLNVNDLDTDSDIRGDFQVLELTHNPDGSVARFAVNFDQYESGATEGLHGQLRYNSTVGLQTEVRALTTSSDVFDEGDLEKVFKLKRTGDKTQPLTVTFQLGSQDSDGGKVEPTLYTATIPAGRTSVYVALDFSHQPSLPSDFTFTYTLKLLAPADHSYLVPRNEPVKVTFHQ